MNDSTPALSRMLGPIESGFIAAGVTISVIAGMQALAILLRWVLIG